MPLLKECMDNAWIYIQIHGNCMDLDLADFHMPRMHGKCKEYARIVHEIFYELISMQEKCKNFAGMMHGSILLFKFSA